MTKEPTPPKQDRYNYQLQIFFDSALVSLSAVTLICNWALAPKFTNNVYATASFLLATASFGIFAAITSYHFASKHQTGSVKIPKDNTQLEHLLELVNSMGDAVVTTDERGMIKVYNAALLSLLDTNESLVGKNIDDVLQLHDRVKQSVAILQDARTLKKVFVRTDLVYKNLGDNQIRLYLNVAPIKPGYQSHGESGFIFIIRDITKEKTLEEERDEFVSVISHELRSPIAIAEGNLSNLVTLQERGAAKDILKQTTSDAYEQILYLAQMINDLATLSRAERGVDTGGMEEIDTVDLLGDLYKRYLPEAQKKQLHLNLDVPAHLPPVRTSRLYIEEILQNFITNALKYTKKGSVTIIGHKVPEGVYIGVKDSGIGMSKGDQRHLFEKFYRSEDYRTQEISGTGLGLYISKKLADKMNIKINFESRLNHGSTFSVTLRNVATKDT